MIFNSDIHHRRSIRLKGYDYAQVGAYFVTICAYKRECLFGSIVDGEMKIKPFGDILAEEWRRSAELRPQIELTEYVVMPNHFHGIVLINHMDTPRRTHMCRAVNCRADGLDLGTPEQFGKPLAGTLPTIMRSFKAAVTRRINELRDTPGSLVWQSNYHEHIIRNDSDYACIAKYIAYNPHRWIEDSLHPDFAILDKN